MSIIWHRSMPSAKSKILHRTSAAYAILLPRMSLQGTPVPRLVLQLHTSCMKSFTTEFTQLMVLHKERKKFQKALRRARSYGEVGMEPSTWGAVRKATDEKTREADIHSQMTTSSRNKEWQAGIPEDILPANKYQSFMTGFNDGWELRRPFWHKEYESSGEKILNELLIDTEDKEAVAYSAWRRVHNQWTREEMYFRYGQCLQKCVVFGGGIFVLGFTLHEIPGG